MKAEYAAQRQAAAAYRMLGDEYAAGVEDPLRELLAVGREVLAWKRVCREMVGGLTEIRYKSLGSGERVRAEIQLYERSLDRAAKLLADLTKLGIEERLARVSEQQAGAVVGVIQSILTDPAVALSGDQLRAARGAAAHYLRALRPVPAGDAVGAQ